MGFSVSLAAVPLAQKDAFLRTAGVHVTDQPDPDGQGPISAVEHRGDYLIWRNLRAVPEFCEPDWHALSDASPVTVLDVVDTAGAQVLRHHDNGQEVWEVSFQDTNDDLLLVNGSVPFGMPLCTRLRNAWLTKHPEDAGEDDADLLAGYGMEIPSRLFEELTGLYYEDGPPEGLMALSGDLPQVKLTWSGKRTDPADKPWWKIW